MSALQELRRSGRLGDAGARLLYETVAAVVRFSNIPPPEGHAAWTREAVLEVAHEFLGHSQTPRRLTTIAAEAVDEDSLGRLFEAAVRNYLRDHARATDRGALMRRLRDVLDNSGVFTQVAPGRVGAGRWALATDDDPQPWGGRIDDLVAASWEAEGINVIRWRHARRRGPTASRESLVRFLAAVLLEAKGSVRLDDLARVAEQRFGLATAPDVRWEDTAEPEAEDDPATDITVVDQVADVWEELSLRERVILAHSDVSVRELADVLQLKKSAAAEARRQLIAKLKLLLGDSADPDEVALRLVDEARLWVSNRTGVNIATSEERRDTASDGEQT